MKMWMQLNVILWISLGVMQFTVMLGRIRSDTRRKIVACSYQDEAVRAHTVMSTLHYGGRIVPAWMTTKENRPRLQFDGCLIDIIAHRLNRV